jgi:hypothetical protein
MKSQEELLQDISDRVAASVGERALATVDERLSTQKLQELVKACLTDLDDDDPVVRKMRFGKKADDALMGSKFARWGLDVADVEFLYDLQSSLKGQKKVDTGFYEGPSEELTRSFKALTDAYYLTEEESKAIDKRAIDNLFARIPKSFLQGKSRYAAKAEAQRAMDTAETGFGLQLIGAQYVRDLWDVSRAESRVAALIDSFEMTDPVAYLPVEVDIPEMLFVGENTANNSSDYTTVKTGSQRVSVTAKKFIIHQMWSGELEEDSIIPFVPFLRRQAALSIAHYTDSLVLNGDDTNAGTGNINLDDADPADTKHYLAFDGIRHAALVDNTANSLNVAGAPTLATLRSLRGMMQDSTRLVDWGHPTNMDDVVYVADPQTADAIAAIDEILSWRINNANAGPLLGGEVARVLGHPVLSSMAMPLTEADGKVSTTGSNNTKGQIAAINRRAWKIGWRRRVKVETERLPGRDQTRIVYSLRMGFGRFTPTGAASGIEAAAVGYNITV